MKKIFLALVCLIFILAVQKPASAYNLSDRHDIFTPAFQLLWNDFSDKFANGRVNFLGIDPKVVYPLNYNDFTTDDIDESSYYKIIAPKSYELKAKIQREIFEKFNETSKILDDIDWTSRDIEEYILYAMLKKNVEFPKEFEILDNSPFNNSKETVKYFGVTKNANAFSQQIKPLFYFTDREFAISLTTKSGDRIILYRTNSKENVYTMYSDLDRKINKRLKFGDSDKLMVPFVSINEKIEYDELCMRKIVGTKYIIAKAIEAVEFNLDNKGATLKNEAAMDIVNMSMPIPGRERIYDFNKPFVLYMIAKDKALPYFAIRINDTRFLVK